MRRSVARFPITVLALVAAVLTAGFLQSQNAMAQPPGPIVWKMQSTWPTAVLPHISFLELAKKVETLSGGRLKWEILPAGAVVPAFEVLDAVHKGLLDGGHSVPAYWFGKHRATSLFGTTPGWGMDAFDTGAWYYQGGGEELYRELLQDRLKLDVVALHYGYIPSQAFGWFKKDPIKSVAALKGLKFRTVGLAADLFKEMGAVLTVIPIGEVVPAIERGVLDAAEVCCPQVDAVLGFPDVLKAHMVWSFHQTAEYFELLVNKKKWDDLPPDLKTIVRLAIKAESMDAIWRDIDLQSRHLEEMVTKKGVRISFTPGEILTAQLKAWDRVIEREARADPFFAKVVESQKAWAKRVVPYRHMFSVPRNTAYDYYWKK